MLKSKLKANCGKAAWLIAAVIGFYYTVVIFFSSNFPISDDFALVDFVTNITTTPDLTKSLKLFYTQHNEHRIITTKLIFLLDFWLFDGLNFRHLILIGNLFHLGTFYLVIKHAYIKFGLRCNFAIFAACMVFQFGSAQSMLWSMAAISNYLVLMLALLTLSLLSKEGFRNYILAILVAVLAVFTQGNGILLPFIAITYLIGQKRYRDSFITGIIALIVGFVYFFDFQVPAQHSNPLKGLHDLGKILVFAMSFTGSAFGMGGSHYHELTKWFLIPALTLGAIIWAITGYGIYKRSYSDGNIFIWFNVFVILTAIITAMSRINFGLSQSMTSRYHIYSNLAIISTVALAQELLPISQYCGHALGRMIKMSVVVSVAYVVVTFAVVLYFYLVVFSPIHSGGIIFPDKDRAIMILERAQKSGVFVAQGHRM